MADESALMEAIARKLFDDATVMDALMPGSAEKAGVKRKQGVQSDAISIKGLTPGVAFQLATCCFPVPGDRIIGVRRPDEPVEVHTIDCRKLAESQDADWVDLAWGDGSDGGTARLTVIVAGSPSGGTAAQRASRPGGPPVVTPPPAGQAPAKPVDKPDRTKPPAPTR